MANTVTIYAGADGFVKSQGTSSWAATRDATSGSSIDTTSATQAIAQARHSSGRGGDSWVFIRSFFSFDTSSITTLPQRATLKVHGSNYNSADLIAVKSNADFGSGLSTADFDAIEGWVAGANNLNNVTNYSEENETWSISAYNNFPLNAVDGDGNAIRDIRDLGRFQLCLIELDYDLRNAEATEFNVLSWGHYTEYTGTSRDPYLDIVTGDDANFFGTNF
jgi:hypothetical protein